MSDNMMSERRRLDGYALSDFAKGQRVELDSITAAYGEGERYGTVERIGRSYVTVRLEKSGRSFSYLPSCIMPAMDSEPANRPAVHSAFYRSQAAYESRL